MQSASSVPAAPYNLHSILRIPSASQAILMTESPVCPKKNREKMTSIVFESLKAPAFYVSPQCLLSFFASGRSSGISVECGHGVTHTVPIYEGHMIPHAIKRLDVAGSTVTGYLSQLLPKDHGLSLVELQTLKEKLAYVALNYDEEIHKPSAELEKIYDLPDGRRITVGRERLRCSEALFDPELLGLESTGLPQKVYDTIQHCDTDHRSSFWPNILLSGGTTLLPGFVERLRREMISLGPATMRIHIVAPAERALSVWIGGSILGSLSTFPKMWISKDEYEETGPYIVNRKCF